MPAEGNQPPAPPTHPLPFCLLPTHETAWDPSTANVTLNVRLDGCIVPSEASAEGARIAYSHAGTFVTGCIHWGRCPRYRPLLA